jgi:hypothetical protein
MQRQDRVDCGHAEQIRHACPPAAGFAAGYKPNPSPQSGLNWALDDMSTKILTLDVTE